MNTRGIALAADSAVTLGAGEKIFFTAQKLFELAPAIPVGILVYDNADLAGVPWETIVAGYRKHLGSRRHGTLTEYLSDFVAFIEGAKPMFPEEEQRKYFADTVASLWIDLYARPWKEELDTTSRRGGDDRYELLRRRIAEDHTSWEQCPPLEGVDPNFPDAVIADSDDALKKIEDEVFESNKLPKDIRDSLRKSLRFFLSRKSGEIGDGTGLVIAGMGEAEHFPGLLQCYAGPIVKGRLRVDTLDSGQISPTTNSAWIKPFAQSATIELIISGIHPGLRAELPGLVSNSIDKETRKGPEDGILKRFQDDLDKQILGYSSPYLDAVEGMPRLELAAMAEVLVNLTVFRRHASVGSETVAGPIDVALLSKDDGFVWVNRKRSRGLRARPAVSSLEPD